MKIIKWKKIYMIDYYMYNKYFVNYVYRFEVCEVLNISVCLFMYIIDICLLIILCG